VAGEIVSLPMFPQLREEQQQQVVAAIASFMMAAQSA
jgi:dTDP-4-amino-4,6-dideoxygalactose transaminase